MAYGFPWGSADRRTPHTIRRQSVVLKASSVDTARASAAQAPIPAPVMPSTETALLVPPVPPPSMDKAFRRKWVMEETCSFLKNDLDKIFTTGEITPYRYSPNIRFEDPITSCNDLNAYV
eukprot:gene28062-31165_t